MAVISCETKRRCAGSLPRIHLRFLQKHRNAQPLSRRHTVVKLCSSAFLSSFFFLFFFSFNLKTIFSPLLHNDSISIVTIQRFVLLLKYHGTSLYVGQNAEKTTPEIKDKKEPYVSWKFTTIRYSWLYSQPNHFPMNILLLLLVVSPVSRMLEILYPRELALRKN